MEQRGLTSSEKSCKSTECSKKYNFFYTATPSSSFTDPPGPLAYLDHLLEEEVWLKLQTLWCNGTEMLTRGPSVLSGTRGVRSAVSLARSLMKAALDTRCLGGLLDWLVGWFE